MQANYTIRDTKQVDADSILALYNTLNWSSAKKPQQLLMALENSHSLITAWLDERLIGLANAISDGHLVVYYPHVLVHPDHQRCGVGRMMLARLLERYEGFHQHAVLADKNAVEFYQRCGFGVVQLPFDVDLSRRGSLIECAGRQPVCMKR